MVNPLCYFEIPVLDMKRAMAFYAQVFETDFEQATVDGNEMAFFPIDTAAPGASGALAQGPSYQPGKQGPRIYFRAADVAVTLNRAIAAGGRSLYPPISVPGYGWVAEFEDSEGNGIALFTPADVPA